MLINGAWSTWCVHASLTGLRALTTDRAAAEPTTVGADGSVVIVVPMLHEADRAADCVDHWAKLRADHPQLRLCVVTTERERHERPTGPHSWDSIARAVTDRRTQHLHYPRVNRTYGEQLGWALDRLTSTADAPDYLYVANIDSRVSADGCAEIIELAAAGVGIAQQSSVFFANLAELSPAATAEAFYQSRWTFEHEILRYLADTGQFWWLPTWIGARWYQHAVGHGLLISRALYQQIGGLPHPRFGLEDAALGVAVRTAGHRIHPFATLECGDAPRSVRELQRQRRTWIRGPLCSLEYARTGRGLLIAAQGTYGGLKWVTGLPVQVAALLLMSRRQRVVAAAGWLLALYGPLLRLLTGLRSLDFPAEYRPTGPQVATGSALYPVAVLSCWAGGVRGLIGLVGDIVTGRTPIQQRTRETQ